MKVKVRRKTTVEAKLEALLRSPEGQWALAAGSIYLHARCLGYLPALNMARCAATTEERNFFTYVADMNLQREQQAYIRNERYEQTEG